MASAKTESINKMGTITAQISGLNARISDMGELLAQVEDCGEKLYNVPKKELGIGDKSSSQNDVDIVSSLDFMTKRFDLLIDRVRTLRDHLQETI